MHFHFSLFRESFATASQAVVLTDGSVVLWLRVEAKPGREDLVDLDQVVHQAVRWTTDAWREQGGKTQTLVVVERIFGVGRSYEIRNTAKEIHTSAQGMDREALLAVFEDDPLLTNKLTQKTDSLYS